MQRNMAANCGMDYRAAGEFVASMALTSLPILESGAERDNLHGAYTQVEAQDPRLVPRSDEGLQWSENMLLHSAQCHSSRALAGGQPNRHLRAELAAKLRLKQALPMLKGLVARVLCEDSRCSISALEVCHHADNTSAGYIGSEELPSGVHLAAPAGLSSTEEAVPISGRMQHWKGIDDGDFWQTMRRLALNIETHVAGTAAHGNTIELGQCKTSG